MVGVVVLAVNGVHVVPASFLFSLVSRCSAIDQQCQLNFLIFSSDQPEIPILLIPGQCPCM